MKISTTGQMDFYGFVEAIQRIASKLYPPQFSDDKVSVLNKIIG